VLNGVFPIRRPVRAPHPIPSFLALGAVLVGCPQQAPIAVVPEVCEAETSAHGESTVVDRDLEDILASGRLVVALAPDPTSWFLESRRLRGFEHDLIVDYARSKGLAVELEPVASVSERLTGLSNGRFDLVAGRLGALGGVRSVGLVSTERLVLQSADTAPDDRVFELSDLLGRRVSVVEGAGHEVSLEGLGFGVDVLPDAVLLEDAAADLLPGEILVARADLAGHLDAEKLVFGPMLPGSVSVSAAACADCVALQLSFENWLAANPRKLDKARSRYLDRRAEVRGGSLSRYDKLFRAQAGRVGWSWTLLAAQAWQESRYRPLARSPVGAVGLMQIMPATAEELGIDDPTDPAQSVRGAVDYLRRLDRYYRSEIPDSDARVPFVLAAYNAGMGHVDDARRLAAQGGGDDERWEEVAPWMLALSEREWNRHPVVRNGYCRGREPVDYVARVMRRGAAYDALLEGRGTR